MSSFSPQPASYPYGAYPSTQYSGVNYQWPYYTPQTSASKLAPSATTPATVPASSQQRSTTTTASSLPSSSTRETVAAASTGGATGRTTRKQATIKGLFAKELKNLMYGFGDDRNPANDTVNVMEEILIEYIMDVCQTAGGPSRKVRLSIEDLRKALSRPADAKKLARMEELLFMQEDIKRARAQFEDTEMGQKGF